jgi:multidrug efflux pump subunit AcrA (membrane-fusion protein)
MNHKIRVILLTIIIIYTFAWSSCTSTGADQEYIIKKGEFIATLNETGELDAVNSRDILVPHIGWHYGWGLKIVGLVDHGTLVSAGDSIAQIDKNSVLKTLVERQNDLEIEQANLRKLKVQHKSTLRLLETELESSEAALLLSKIQLDRAQFESEKNKKIDQLEYERDLIKFKKIEKNYYLKQELLKNELKIQKIKIFQLENEVQDANEALTKLVIRSPLDGMMQLLENRRTNQIVKVGDEMGQGRKFACVPDLSSMKVKSTVNEADIAKVYHNQKVIIRLDAFPSVPFDGKIIEIGRLSKEKDEKSLTKIFDIVILLDKSDPILKPGMTVRCEFLTAQMDDVYYIENQCVIRENMRYYMFVEGDGDYEKREIEIGPRNNKYTVLHGEYTVGQSVLPLTELENSNLSKSDLELQ